MKLLNKKSDKIKRKFLYLLEYGTENEILNFIEVNDIQALINLNILIGRLNPGNYQELMGTPLHIAVKKNYIKVTDRLIRLGANLNLMDSRGDTPLHIAASCLNKSLVNLLISYNAKVDVQNLWCDTPFLLTVTFSITRFIYSASYRFPETCDLYNHASSIVKNLIHAGANVYLKGAGNISAVERAKYHHNALYNIIEKEIKSYREKIKSYAIKAESIINYHMELVKTSLSELAIEKVINYLDSEKNFHDNVVVDLIKWAKEISASKRIEQASSGKEYKFDDYLGAVKKHTIKNVINSDVQQKYYRKSFYPEESFVERENIRIVEQSMVNQSGFRADNR